MFVVDILKNTGFLNTAHADMRAVLTRAGVSSHCAGSFLTNIAVLSIMIFVLVSATVFVVAILAAFDVYGDAFTRSTSPSQLSSFSPPLSSPCELRALLGFFLLFLLLPSGVERLLLRSLLKCLSFPAPHSPPAPARL
jgi:hypothetical protein